MQIIGYNEIPTPPVCSTVFSTHIRDMKKKLQMYEKILNNTFQSEKNN